MHASGRKGCGSVACGCVSEPRAAHADGGTDCDIFVQLENRKQATG